MLAIIFFLIATMSLSDAWSLKFTLCTKVNERPGICPSYSGTCVYPYPLRVSQRKSFKCICDTDCKKNYKCCEDSCYSHGICKRVIFGPTITTTTINPLGRFLSAVIPRPVAIKYVCHDEEQHPGLCPSYSIIHATPLPKHISWNKPYRCKCDSDCKANYKCCEDSYFEHGVCKPAVHLPMETVSSDIEYSGSGDNINDNYTVSGDFSGNKESERFSGSGQNNIDDEFLTTRIPSKYVNNDEDFEFSGLNEAIIDNYSGSGDFSGDTESERYSGSGHRPIDNNKFSDNEQINRTIHISSFIDDEDFEFSGFDEKIMDKYSGSGDFNVDKESERFSGSGHGSIDNDVEYLVARMPITVYFNDVEDFEFSGFDEKIIDYYSGSDGFSVYEDSERFSGSGHGSIDNDIEFLVTRMPITIYFNDDEDFEFSGFDEKIVNYYNGSGDFSGDYENERYSGSGHAPINNYAFTDSFDQKNHYSGQNAIQNLAAVDKFHVKEKFVDNSNSKIKNTETSKKSDKNIIIEEPDDIYFFEPDKSDISHDTETQIYPSNKYANENEQNSEDNSNKLDDIHLNKYKHDDDF